MNGVRYPPDKNGRLGNSGHGGGGSGNTGGGTGSNAPPVQGYQDNRPGMSTTSPHLQHMANQVEHKKIYYNNLIIL